MKNYNLTFLPLFEEDLNQYVVQGTTMEVRRILYGRQDWKKHL